MQFHSILCLYVADPANVLASNRLLDLIFFWEQLVYSVMEKIKKKKKKKKKLVYLFIYFFPHLYF